MGEPWWRASAVVGGTNHSGAGPRTVDWEKETNMATKLNDRTPKTGGSRAPDSKRIEFDHGQAKTNGGQSPLKTGDVEKE